MSYILYKIPDESKYSEFEIPKKSGGVRKIQAPTSRLKKLQRRLANLLSDCEEELFESQIKSEGDKKRYSRTGSHVLKLDEQYLMAIKRDYRFQPMLNCMSVNDTYLTLI